MSRQSAASAPPGVQSPPVQGLRERKKAATMHHIQETALALFAEHGFDAVTIEQVADAADVSPSTVYRYFGTKEGVILHDEYDDQLLVSLAHYLGEDLSPWEAAEAAFSVIEQGHFVDEEESTRARIRLWFEVPSIRSAAYLVIDDVIDDLARAMTDTGRWSFPESRIIASGIVWPFIAALRNWHDSGAETGWREHAARALTVLRKSAISAS
ncbi:TetR/AcrR family transcriptional regulator [Ornithinimicrobium faecis]|uniref:TetR/AcrR family transcriptional regulator n=1 Tax=Ornithinimicrobium faecis TaxID=2934158 RepID=UPI00211895FC|nr:TetR family transcriptional regulator [Ornithinimicrobium sp. HY1745]